VTFAAYCDVAPRVTVAAPVTVTVTSAVEAAGFEPLLLPHAMRRRATPLTDAPSRL
jgi:hypothetical protein